MINTDLEEWIKRAKGAERLVTDLQEEIKDYREALDLFLRAKGLWDLQNARDVATYTVNRKYPRASEWNDYIDKP